MANNVAHLKAETLNETPANVEAKVVVETKADTLRNVHTWQHSGGYEAIKYIMPDTLIEWDADTNEEIVVTIKAQHSLTGLISSYQNRKRRHFGAN